MNSVRKDPTLKKLLTRFESLGDHCEFGLVQRHFGVDLPGLLRFGHITVDNLISALENRFEGVGEPENTYVCLNENREYFVGDTRWFRMHTWIRESELPWKSVLENASTYLGVQTRRLVADLEDGDKIFVHRKRVNPLTTDEIDRLQKSITANFPRAAFMVTSLATLAHPAGTVELVSPRILCGYIDRYSADDSTPISYSCWEATCRNAERLGKQLGWLT